MTREENLLALISEIVVERGKTWREKRQQILDGISDDDKSNLEEFCYWFQEQSE